MSTLGSQWLRLRVGLPSLGLVLMAGGAVRAQETRSTLLGTVKDATGALVPGAFGVAAVPGRFGVVAPGGVVAG